MVRSDAILAFCGEACTWQAASYQCDQPVSAESFNTTLVWDAAQAVYVASPPLVLYTFLPNARNAGPAAAATSALTANITLLSLSTGAAALDGSPYGFYFVKYEGDVSAHRDRWTISIEGGGWCVGVSDCFQRSQERMHDGKPGSLGSSIPYHEQQHGCGCMNTNATDVLSESCNCILMLCKPSTRIC